MVNDTLLDLGLRITSGNRFGEAIQVIYTDNEDILDAAVSQIIHHSEPELGGFILANPHPQHIFVPVQIDTNHHVGCLVHNGSVLFHFEMNRVHEDHRVHALKRPILPLFNERDDIICDIRNECRLNFNSIQILKVILNLTGTDAFGIEGDDLVFDARHVLLMLLHDNGLKLAHPIP